MLEYNLNYQIIPIANRHIRSFWETTDAVFRESRMLAFSEAPPIGEVTEFVSNNIRNNEVQFVATINDTVIGWCDVLSNSRPTKRHTGVLGMGVLKSYRGIGVGKSLIKTALDAAKDHGLKRIELTVRTTNESAKGLYESFGFVVEGILRKHIFIDGDYYDSYLMAVLFI